MGRTRLSVAVLGLTAVTLFANSNRKGTWYTYETENFKIYFHEEIRGHADTAVDFLERSYRQIQERLRLQIRTQVKIHVVLTGMPDVSNGSATPIGHEIQIFVRPGSLLHGDQINWFKRVLAHELTHQMTFLALRNFFLVYGELYKSFYVPIWFLEGIAQYAAETWDAKRQTFITHALYNSALEPYEAINTFTKTDAISGRLVYEQGHQFVRYLAHRFGARIMGEILYRFSAFFFVSEVRTMLSPLFWKAGTSFFDPPFEKAVRRATGYKLNELWADYNLQLNKYKATLDTPMKNPVADYSAKFDFVFHMKYHGDSGHFFTAQKDWDTPRINIYHSDGKKIRSLGVRGTEALFDVSPGFTRLAYVKDYTDVDGEPRRKAYVRDLKTGKDTYLDWGAYHPAFIGNDRIALAHFKRGKTTLKICDLKKKKVKCETIEGSEKFSDIYGLSSSNKGFLFTGVDVQGRTSIYEYQVKDKSIELILKDSVYFMEFPVEASDSTIFYLREQNNIFTLMEYNLNSKEFSVVLQHPLGVLLPHRSAPGRFTILSAGNSAKYSSWSLLPYEVDRNRAAKIVNSAPVSFLKEKWALHPDTQQTTQKPVSSPYYSPLGLRPWFLFPYVSATPLNNFGLAVPFSDPLGLHFLNAGIAFFGFDNQIRYQVDYSNLQLPIHWTYSGGNTGIFVDDSTFNIIDPAIERVDELYAREGDRHFLTLQGQNFVALPDPHVFFLGAGGSYQKEYLSTTLAYTTHQNVNPKAPEKIWRRELGVSYSQLAMGGWSWVLPSSFHLAHPLYHFHLLGMHENINGRLNYKNTLADVRFTYRLGSTRLTHTLWYNGWRHKNHGGSDLDFQSRYDTDDGRSIFYFPKTSKWANTYYTSLNIPIYRGSIITLPVFGHWNYVGTSIFYARGQTFSRNLLPGPREEVQQVGMEALAQFIFMKKIPLLLRAVAFKEIDEKIIRIGFVVSGGWEPMIFSYRDGFRFKDAGYKLPVTTLPDHMARIIR